jgi:hypothetical protein
MAWRYLWVPRLEGSVGLNYMCVKPSHIFNLLPIYGVAPHSIHNRVRNVRKAVSVYLKHEHRAEDREEDRRQEGCRAR